MPIDVLTREDFERRVMEVVKRQLEEMGLPKRLSELEISLNELKNAVSKQPPLPTSQMLMADLGERARLLNINFKTKPVTLRPKQWLRSDDFRIIVEVIRRHGGTWSSEKRAFVIG